MNEIELLANIRSAMIHKRFALEEELLTGEATNFSWVESKHYVPYNTYKKIKTVWLKDNREITHYYDVYTETLHLSSWVYQDE